jgi:diaminopimelate decarboxylase
MTFENEAFCIQSVSLVDIAKTYGSPVYVYDAAKIKEKVDLLKSAFSDINMKIKYACKANTNISILALMRTYGVELDVVSPQEMELGLVAGFEASQITYTSSGVAFEEIEACVSKNVVCNIDNLSSLEIFGKKYGNTQPVIVRIRPNVMAGGNLKISTGHKDSKFGIAVEQVELIHDLRKKYDLKIIGIHQHTGSDIKDPEAYTEASKIIFDLALGFPDLKIVDLGGGFKVSYKKDDKIIDIDSLAQKLVPAFKAFCAAYGKELELWFEPGKFLVSECGYLLAQVNVVKENPNKTLLGLNTGLNHLIRPMMYDAFHDVINISKPLEKSTKTYDLVGYMCETDNIALDRELPMTEEGDIIAIKNAGAYGFVMASQYNARFRPPEVLILNGRAELIRKRETFEDIRANQILLAL